jgi:hypothetical protein
MTRSFIIYEKIKHSKMTENIVRMENGRIDTIIKLESLNRRKGMEGVDRTIKLKVRFFDGVKWN